METTYTSISCSYYDRLEAWAVRKVRCTIVFQLPGSAAPSLTEGYIIDVFSKDGAEYLKTDTQEVIRLDYLKSVNGIDVPSSNACAL